MEKDIELSAEEALEIYDILEEVVVSLDRIGSREAAGEDPGHANIWEYFTTDGATRRLSRARSILSQAYSRTYDEEQLESELYERKIMYWNDRHPDR